MLVHRAQLLHAMPHKAVKLKVRHTCPHKEEREKTSWFPDTVVHYSVTSPAYPAALKPSSKMPSMATLGHRRRTEMLEIS